jgi:hypothetical protein
LNKPTRQQAYQSVTATIISLVLSNKTHRYTNAANLEWSDVESMKKLNEGLSKINLTGLDFEVALKAEISQLQLNGQDQGFWDFVKSVTNAAGTAIKTGINWCTSNTERAGACAYAGKTVACAATTFFGFPICIGDSITMKTAAAYLPMVKTSPYEPICLSKCQTCLEYAVPGYNDVWCKYDNYKSRPDDASCLQGCPTQTTNKLLGEATTLVECYALCKTA